jgi:hypothetical protein
MLRAHAAIGMGAASLVLVATSVANLLKPHVDPLDDPVSNLARGHMGQIVGVTFVVAGLGLIALAAALRRTVRGGPRWAATTPMALGGVCILLLAVFRADPTIVPSTMEGRVHLILAGFGFLCLGTSFLVHTELFRLDPRWQGPNRYLRPLAWCGLGLFYLNAALLVGGIVVGPLVLIGLFERLMMGTMLGWTALTSLHLRRLSRSVPSP